ncbi:enoyl-CoA hydratase/isomerase family protein [Thermodesulfobacteriota bacterium]
MNETFETILYEKKDAVATITLNRPDRRNAFNTTMYRDLDQALGLAEEDKGVRAIILTGSGDKAFSAGADLDEHHFKNLGESMEYISIDAKAFRRIENVPQPVIAAVNGAAIGGGCKIAIVSDIAIASEKAIFSLPGARFGFVHTITLGRGREVLGRQRLARMLLTGETIDAGKAEAYGLVSQVVPHDQLMAEAEKVAEQIASFPPLTTQVTKRMLHRGMDDDYRWEDLLSPGLLLMEDVQEGLRAFDEKRKPKFEGK